MTSQTQRVVVSAAVSGNNTIVAAVAGRRIRVLAAVLTAAGTVAMKFQSGTTIDLTGAMARVANTTLTLPFNSEGWFETAVGALLNLNLNAAVAVTGMLTYVEVS